jgi:hypothetical protein
MWQVKAYVVIREPDGSWRGKEELDAELLAGWEPFAVTENKDHFYGLLYHLRKKSDLSA